MVYYLKGFSEHTIKNTPGNEKIKELVERWDSGYSKNIEKGIEIYNKLSDEEISYRYGLLYIDETIAADGTCNNI